MSNTTSLAVSDPEALMALHTAGTAIVNLVGRRVLDRESYAKAMAGALASPLSDVLTTAQIDDIRLATPDVAIVSATKTIHGGRWGVDASTALSSTGALTYATTRSRGGWRIALADQTDPYAHQTMTRTD